MPGATALPLPPRATFTTDPVFRLTVAQYHEMIGQGTLTADDPVELIEGVLVYKMSKNPPHIAASRRCRRAVEGVLPPSYFYDAEQPITLPDGEPEPDGMVVRGSIEDYDTSKVRPADVAFVIEIADATLASDRGVKLRSYARAGVACYWIVNLIDRQIEVYSGPDATAAVPGYGPPRVFKPGDEVPVLLDGVTRGAVPVADVLPPE